MTQKLVTVNGIAALQRKLRRLPIELQEKHNQDATRAGAEVVAERARDGVVKDSGDLAQTIKTRKKNTKNRFLKAAVVRPVKTKGIDPYYWRFVEFGTIKMSAKPFLRPAFDARTTQAIRAYRDKMRSGLKQEAKK